MKANLHPSLFHYYYLRFVRFTPFQVEQEFEDESGEVWTQELEKVVDMKPESEDDGFGCGEDLDEIFGEMEGTCRFTQLSLRFAVNTLTLSLIYILILIFFKTRA